MSTQSASIHPKIRPMTCKDMPLLAAWIPDVPLWRGYRVTAQAAQNLKLQPCPIMTRWK